MDLFVGNGDGAVILSFWMGQASAMHRCNVLFVIAACFGINAKK